MSPALEIQLTLLWQAQLRAGQLQILALNVCDTVVVILALDILVAVDPVARAQRGPAGAQRHANADMLARGPLLGPGLHQMVDGAALAHRQLALGRSFLQPPHACVEIAPRLPRLVLAILDRLLALSEVLDAGVEGREVAQVLDLAAGPGGQAGFARDGGVDLADAEQGEVAQPLLHDRCGVGTADRGDPGWHKLQNQAVDELQAAGGRNPESGQADLQLRMRTQPAELPAQAKTDGVIYIADGHVDGAIPGPYGQARGLKERDRQLLDRLLD